MIRFSSHRVIRPLILLGSFKDRKQQDIKYLKKMRGGWWVGNDMNPMLRQFVQHCIRTMSRTIIAHLNRRFILTPGKTAV
jgi:hypothetical protein